MDGREAAGWMEGHLMDRWLVGRLARGRTCDCEDQGH